MGSTIRKILPVKLCFINVYTYHNPKSTPYSNADTLNIVVQREKTRCNIDARMRSKPRYEHLTDKMSGHLFFEWNFCSTNIGLTIVPIKARQHLANLSKLNYKHYFNQHKFKRVYMSIPKAVVVVERCFQSGSFAGKDSLGNATVLLIDILSYPSHFPTSAYCACAHQYCILFHTLNNNI